jgi:hypothetical protein
MQVLRFADGREAVRLTVNENGSLALKSATDLHCSLFLLVKRSVADESGMAKSEPGSRFDWQVNGDTPAPQKRTKELALGSQEHRLSVPLDPTKDTPLEVALTDHITGWALVTKIQLQPRP